MRLFIDYDLNGSGKGKFLTRLLSELDNLGVQRVDKLVKADVVLGVSKWRRGAFIEGIPKVLRIDGVHVNDTPSNRYKNTLIRKSIKQSDAVIYQSAFAQRMVNGILGVNHDYQYVIYNGGIRYFPKKETDPKQFRIVMVGNWGDRPTKRLKEMYEISKMMPTMNTVGRQIRFYVYGEVGKEFTDTVNCHFFGYEQWPKVCDYDMMLNLQWFDWCPNAVVESLCNSVPVMCGNGCGVEEIVRDNGWVLPINKPLEPKMFKYDAAPDFDKVMVARKIIEVSTQRPKEVDAKYLSIETIAKQYLEVFEGVLNVRR